MQLAMHEADAMHATGRAIPRPLEEVAGVNQDWETDCYTCLALIRWAEDYYKLPAELRESLEKDIPQEG